MSNPDASPPTRTIARLLTTVSHASTPFISTFLLVHLAAPVFANMGGTNAASRIMLLGREYYQTDFGETYLVLGPIVLHTLAGISKRFLLLSGSSSSSDSRQNNDDTASTPAPTPLLRPLLRSALSVTGYATALFFLPIHFLVHREYPAAVAAAATAGPPLSLDFEYVKFGLQTWPKRSWLLYAGLVGFAALHAADGMTVIWNTWLRDYWGRASRRTRRAFMLGGVVVPVLAGLGAIAREPPGVTMMMSSFVTSWYKAAYMESFIFRT